MNLIKEARNALGNLQPAETQLLINLALGQKTELDAPSSSDIHPYNVNHWPNDNIIRAEMIRWVLTYLPAREILHEQGFWLSHAIIDGVLDLKFSTIPIVIVFDRCFFSGSVGLFQSNIKGIVFNRCFTHNIHADGVNIEKNFSFRYGSISVGGISLTSARIGMTLDLSGATLIQQGSYALNASQMAIGDSLFARATYIPRLSGPPTYMGFIAIGGVQISHSRIGGTLDCEGGWFFDVTSSQKTGRIER